MKGFGVVLLIVGVLLMVGAIFSSINRESKAPVAPSAFQVTAENGESMAILPLLGVVSLATGGALIVASIITKRA